MSKSILAEIAAMTREERVALGERQARARHLYRPISFLPGELCVTETAFFASVALTPEDEQLGIITDPASYVLAYT